MPRLGKLIKNNKLSQYKISKLDKKKEDWYVADLVAADGYETKGASVNKIDKKTGGIFPGWDFLKEGENVDGELWKSPTTQKWFLFPPKAASQNSQKGPGGAYKQKMIEDTMKAKEASISKFQGSKEEGIKLASTLRMAVDLSVAEITSNKEDDEASLQARIKRWRSWLWAEWEKPITGEVLSHVPEEPPFN